MTTAEDIKKYVENAMKSRSPDDKPIYEIMLFKLPTKMLADKKAGGGLVVPDFRYTCKPGFYHDVDSAVKAMHENACDIQDKTYDAGFVLVRFPGMYSVADQDGRIYFVWNEEKKGFFEAEELENLSFFMF